MSESSKEGSAGRAERLLNFGCGGTFHRDWVNLDASPVSPDVIAHDLRRRFPFADGTFDAVYGSHVLEHLEPETAKCLLRDCLRILKPGGIIRVAVPDLETIARLYLASLEMTLAGDPEAEGRYDWLMLELYDQSVRKVSGGSMAAYLSGSPDRQKSAFVSERIGCEGMQGTTGQARHFPVQYRILRGLRSLTDSVRRAAAAASAFAFLGSRGLVAMREGLFRGQGEVHQWMYDRFSMGRALRQSGFASIRKCRAGESDIADFAGYNLEILDGRERKPDSLYMEARKPAHD